EDGLVAFGHKLLDVVLRPDGLAFHRQFIAEANRFPELAKLFIAKNRVRDIMLQVLTTYAERGAIRLVDPNGADPSGADPSGSDPSGSDPNLSDARLL